jgi:hypothetical protein
MKRSTNAYRAAHSCSVGQEGLEEGELEDVLRNAFAPHRCDVRFQDDVFSLTRKISLRIHVSRIGAHQAEKEFVVEGVPVAALRCSEALSKYVDDVRHQLQKRRVFFAIAPQRSASA